MARIWIAGTSNPHKLPEPPAWWQTIVYDYDKMLRILPSSKDRAYRLCRVARADARLGLQAMGEIHKHPDTVTMINHGLVPISTVMPWAVYSNKILRDLAARDSWKLEGGDPNKIVNRMEQMEAEAERKQDARRADELGQRSSDAFKHVKALKGERLVQSETRRGRVGPTSNTDRTRAKFAVGAPSALPSSQVRSSAVPGGPSGKISGSTRGIVLTDAR